jgi:hypothetical protein
VTETAKEVGGEGEERERERERGREREKVLSNALNSAIEIKSSYENKNEPSCFLKHPRGEI